MDGQYIDAAIVETHQFRPAGQWVPIACQASTLPLSLSNRCLQQRAGCLLWQAPADRLALMFRSALERTSIVGMVLTVIIVLALFNKVDRPVIENWITIILGAALGGGGIAVGTTIKNGISHHEDGSKDGSKDASERNTESAAATSD